MINIANIIEDFLIVIMREIDFYQKILIKSDYVKFDIIVFYRNLILSI
jgi:hypothetical protein